MADTSRTIKLKMDADARGITKATKDAERDVDRMTKSVDKKFRKSGDESGKGFNQSLKKWFGPSGGVGEAGKKAGEFFNSGLIGTLKTPVIGPAILAALGGAVAVAAPAAGAVAASGLVLGFGAGLAGLGIVFAAKSKAVQDTWKKTLSGMGADMSKLSKPFEATLISIAGFAQRTFDKFKPSLEAVFKDIAPAVTKFADQVFKGFEKLQPAIRPLSDAFGAVLDKLGPATQSAIGKVSDGLVNLAESVKKNPDGLADLVTAVGDLTGGLLILTGRLNDAYSGLKNFAGQIPIVSDAIDKAGLSATDYGVIIGSSLIPGLNVAANGYGLLASSADKTTESVGLTGDAVKLYTQGLDDNAVKAILAGKANTGAGSAVDALAAKFDKQWQATQKANQELFRNSGLLLTLSGASIGYEEAVDRATESVKENGKNLDISTEKGRNNQRALDDLVSATNSKVEAQRNSNQGEVAAARTMEAGKKAWIEHAVQMGKNRKVAEGLADKLFKIPNVSRTATLTANIKTLEDRLATAKAKLKDPKLTATQKATLKAEISNLEAGIKKAKGDLAGVPPSKTVTITTVYKTVGKSSTAGFGGGHENTRRASGGPVFAGRSYLVGERGPEILTMGASGSRITNAEQTSQALSQSAGGDTYVFVEIDGQQMQGRITKTIKDNERDTKRRVTAGVR